MNAQLKAIVEQVVERPTYENRCLGFEQDWIKANAVMLRKWWDTLQTEGEEPESSFDLFCQCQHDIQLSLRDAYRETHSRYRDL